MEKDLINKTEKDFESIKHIDENGIEFWYARELMTVLEYKQWRRFEQVIERAKEACKNSNISIDDHFAGVGKIVKAGATNKDIGDIKLTRYACYLIAQNGDSRKNAIALAQTYFAVQTRKEVIMEQNNELKLFEDKKIRAKWDDEQEKWYFSVVDVVAVLTDNDYQKSRNYWKWLKNKLIQEGSELVSNTIQLKMKSVDGKYYNTDVMTTEQILRLIQSIPSKKAEPFKLWLAQVGKERIDEAYDPEIAINRALDIYRKKGYSEEWINQRLKTIDIRKEFTDELKEKGISEAKDFAILTNILTQAWSGHSVKEYKNLKGLKKENLRDNMTNMELVLNMLAETSSTEISKSKKEKGFKEAQDSVIEGGNIARVAREQLEKKTGKKVVSDKNAKEIRKLNSATE